MSSGALWGRVLTDGHELSHTRIVFADGRITAVVPGATRQPGDVVVDEGWIAPGLIDLQVNGAGGVDLTSATDPARALEQVARTLAAHGVTAFCPTVVSSPRELILDRLRAYPAQQIGGGAQALGVHVEGPFINPNQRGVHDPAVLRAPSHEEISDWLDAGPPRIVTLAPECDTDFAAIRQLCAAGVIVSLGHSGADAETTQAAEATGARMATHLFNGMPPLHHRAPGLVGAALASRRLTLGLIADGVHVHPSMVDLVVNRCGTQRVALVSDALASGGMPAGGYVLGGQRVVSDGSSVRREDGTLAGSAMLLDGCLRNARAWLPAISPASLVRMVSQTPAELLGLTHKGRIGVGCHADLVILDTAFNVTQAWVRGTRVLG